MDGRLIWALGPIFVGASLGICAALLASLLARKAPLLAVRLSARRRHRYAVLLPPAAGFIWLIGSIQYGAGNSLFLLNLFFLPPMFFMYRAAPGWLYYLVILGMVPGQYLLAGILVDVIRVGGSLRAKAWGACSAALCLLAFLACFLIYGDPHDPHFPYPDPAALVTIVVAYGAIITVLASLGIKAWRRAGAQRAPGMKSRREQPPDTRSTTGKER